MEKAVLTEITRELTYEQLLAHNQNYENLAQKDLEAYSLLRGRMLDGVYLGRLTGYYSTMRIPIVMCSTDTPRMFFAVSDLLEDPLGLAVSAVMASTAGVISVRNGLALKKRADGSLVTRLDTQTLYCLEIEIVSGTASAYVREASEGDYYHVLC